MPTERAGGKAAQEHHLCDLGGNRKRTEKGRNDLMKQLVFLRSAKDDPYTTSKIVSEMTGISHKRVKEAIRRNQEKIETFGLLVAYASESTGGRPEEFFILNEQQATFVMTLLKNNEKTVAFKLELVRQFFAMREELMRRRAQKEIRKPVRLSLTDTIKALPDSPHKQFKYKQYTDLAYKIAIGKTAKQIRQERGADKKDTASDFQTGKELKAVSDMENRISVLIELGMSYAEIKERLSKSAK